MSDCKRQQIIDAVKARFAIIRQANGYKTNAGANIHEHRQSDWGVEEPEGINVIDGDFDISPMGPGLADHEMLLAVEGVAVGSGSATVVRNVAADILKAIGTDCTLGGLVQDLFPAGAANGEKSNRFGVIKKGTTTSAVELRFVVQYRTALWEI